LAISFPDARQNERLISPLTLILLQVPCGCKQGRPISYILLAPSSLTNTGLVKAERSTFMSGPAVAFGHQQESQRHGSLDGVSSHGRSTPAGQFTEQVVTFFEQRYANTPVDLFEASEIFALAERFMFCRRVFENAGKPVHVTVAFHYTNPENLPSIRKVGLLTSMQQQNGSNFGRGIYVGTNPHAFSCYGQAGIMLLIFQGTVKLVDQYSTRDSVSGVDSFLGNKLMKVAGQKASFPKSGYFDEIILQQSAQALPFVSYPQTAINNAELMYDLQCNLQKAADHFFNEGRTTTVRRVLPSLKEDFAFELKLRTQLSLKARQKIAAQPASKRNKATTTVSPSILEQVQCSSPTKRVSSKRQKPFSIVALFVAGDCPICMVPLNEQGAVARLSKCGHSFHQGCIEKALQMSSNNKCPVCRTVTGDGPIGTCPKGTMTIQLKPDLHCAGHKSHGTFVLTYDIPSGTQSACHPAAGHTFTGTKRTAYVPGSPEGRMLIKRLRYAFARGLVFCVGTSLTTGKPNQVVWASIHHKSTTAGGTHGFPDPGFFINCNEELDDAGVPKAQDL